VLVTIVESPSFCELECCSEALWTDTLIRSSIVRAMSDRFVLANTRVLNGRLSCLLKRHRRYLARKTKGTEVSYTSVDPKAKPTRERCIRVVAIVIIIKQGMSNNCGI
jgi:hypothetical protein